MARDKAPQALIVVRHTRSSRLGRGTRQGPQGLVVACEKTLEACPWHVTRHPTLTHGMRLGTPGMFVERDKAPRGLAVACDKAPRGLPVARDKAPGGLLVARTRLLPVARDQGMSMANTHKGRCLAST